MARSEDDGPPQLGERELSEICDGTLDHYQGNALDFWQGTRDHDVSQNIDALMRHLQGPAPHRVLDLGCGPGRDLVALTARGCEVVGLDGAPAFVAMARQLSGCEVWQQSLLQLQLPAARFDGIFANAVLLHVPRQELARVLGELHAALAPGGVLFASNPRGDNIERWQGDRYCSFLRVETWTRAMIDAGFVELEHYYRPAGRPRAQQPWYASVWRRS